MLGEKIGITIGANTKQAENAIRRFQNSLKGVAKLVTVGVVAKAFKDMASFGKELDLMANRTGMSVEKLSSLRNVFMSAGSGAKGFQQTINKINDGLLGLKRGNPWIAQALAPLGISPFGKDFKQILEEVADAAKAKLSMGYSETTVLDYLMSQLGIDQATAEKMMKGRVEWQKEEARLLEKTGSVSDENVKKLSKLNQSLGELSASWTNAKANVTAFISEFLVPIIDKITEFITFLGNHEVIGAGVGIGTALFGGKLFNAALGFIGKHLFGGLVGGAAATTAATAAGGAATGAAGGGILATVVSILSSPVFLGACALAIGALIGKWLSGLEWFKKGAEGVGDFFHNLFGTKFDPNSREDIKRLIDKQEAMGNTELANALREKYGFGKREELFPTTEQQPEIVYMDEPLISDEDYERPIMPPVTQNVEFHMEGSTYNGASIGEVMDSMTNTVTPKITTVAQIVPTG